MGGPLGTRFGPRPDLRAGAVRASASPSLDRPRGGVGAQGEEGEGPPARDPPDGRLPPGRRLWGRGPTGWARMGITVYLAAALVFLTLLAPTLLGARESVAPGITWVSGFPVAWDGLYFFTGLAVAVTIVSTLRRGAGHLVSPILAVAGMGAYEASYAFAFALTTGDLGRLVPSAGLPGTGWAGFGTWFLAELVVAGLVLVNWEGRGLDRTTVAVGLSFVLLLATWDLLLGWGFPPYQSSVPVLLVNTAAEVTGALWLPLAFTSRRRSGRSLRRDRPGGREAEPRSVVGPAGPGIAHGARGFRTG